jgi:hypothetical protein
MANRQVRAQATNRNGDQLTLHSQETDSPVLPVAQLQALHEFRPDLVDFVIQQTALEAAHRRSQDSRINRYIFTEHVLGQLGAITVAILGIGGGVYAGIHGQPALGGTIATVTIGTLAVAFIRKEKRPQAPPASKGK